MEQLTYVEPGRIERLDVPDPEIQDARQALVKPFTVATCDLDVMQVRGLWSGPIPLGHEGVAEVIEVGDDVDGVEPGDRVVIPFQISCGECPECRRGLGGYCSAHPELVDKSGVGMMYGLGQGARNWGGFLSDTVRVPYADAMLVKLPDGVDPVAAASASDNIPDGYRTVAEPLAANPGARVLVVGGVGGIGLYAAGVAVALGAESVDYVDGSSLRLARAERLGANPIDGPVERLPESYPITVDASADPDGLRLAINSTATAGICTSIGVYFQPQELPLLRMYTRGITFKTGTAQPRRDLPSVLDLIDSGRLHPEIATGVVADWTDAVDALTELSDKTVITR